MKSIFTYNVVVFIVLITHGILYANDSKLESIAQKAQTAYTEGHYVFAIELYDSILKTNNHSAALYYNLGNAYFKNGQMAYAIWYYEKAKKLAPNDDQIVFNINLANTLITDKIDVIPKLFYERWWIKMYAALPIDAWALLCIISFILVFIFFATYLVTKNLFIKKTTFYLSLLLLLTTGLFYAFAKNQKKHVHDEKAAIVFAPRVTVKSSPDLNSIDLFVIHEGSKVFITDKVGNWIEIKLANGNVGWINSNDVKTI